MADEQRRTDEGTAAQKILKRKSHSIGHRWYGVFLHRVNLSPENYVLLLFSGSKALWWLKGN